jgi:hypothetical protein
MVAESSLTSRCACLGNNGVVFKSRVDPTEIEHTLTCFIHLTVLCIVPSILRGFNMKRFGRNHHMR